VTTVRLAPVEPKSSGFDTLIVGVTTSKRESKLEIVASPGLGHAER
jgi:hypothetical protein